MHFVWQVPPQLRLRVHGPTGDVPRVARLDGRWRHRGQRGGHDQKEFAGTEEGILEETPEIRASGLNAGSDAYAAVSAFAVEQKSQEEWQPEPLPLPQPCTQSSKFLVGPTCTTGTQSESQKWATYFLRICKLVNLKLCFKPLLFFSLCTRLAIRVRIFIWCAFQWICPLPSSPMKWSFSSVTGI